MRPCTSAYDRDTYPQSAALAALQPGDWLVIHHHDGGWDAVRVADQHTGVGGYLCGVAYDACYGADQAPHDDPDTEIIWDGDSYVPSLVLTVGSW